LSTCSQSSCNRISTSVRVEEALLQPHVCLLAVQQMRFSCTSDTSGFCFPLGMPFPWTTKGRRAGQTEVRPTHSCPRPRTSKDGGGGDKEKTDEKVSGFSPFLPIRLQIVPPVHLARAWGVSEACCVLLNQCAGPCSLRSPCFPSRTNKYNFFSLSLFSFLARRKVKKYIYIKISVGPFLVESPSQKSLLVSGSLLQHDAHVKEAGDGSEERQRRRRRRQQQRSPWWGILTAEQRDLETWLDPQGPSFAVIRILHNFGSTPSR